MALSSAIGPCVTQNPTSDELTLNCVREDVARGSKGGRKLAWLCVCGAAAWTNAASGPCLATPPLAREALSCNVGMEGFERERGRVGMAGGASTVPQTTQSYGVCLGGDLYRMSTDMAGPKFDLPDIRPKEKALRGRIWTLEVHCSGVGRRG